MKYSFEVVLCVEDYVHDGDTEGAFDLCGDDTTSARNVAEAELVERLGQEEAGKLTVTTVDFVEFDSGNWTHAGGIFRATVEGPAAIVNRIKREMED